MKSFFAILLSMIMVFGVLGVTALGAEEEKKILKFNEDGKFTIMHYSDFQDQKKLKEATKIYIRASLDEYKPDLIVLGGDNIGLMYGSSYNDVKTAIAQFMDIFESYGIPVAIVYGNHDAELVGANKEQQMEIYESYSCFVGREGEDLTGCGTYNLPILSNDETRTAFNIWLTDSGTYHAAGYACVAKDQVEWYKKTAAALKEQNGGVPVPAINFQHIPLYETYEALKEVPLGTPGAVSGWGMFLKFFVLPEGAEGELLKSVCSPDKNNNDGQFDAFVEMGDVVATVSGHDHTNTFEIDYKGVKICNSPTSGFGNYNGANMGSRIFELNEDGSFDTYCVKYTDLLGDDARAMTYYNYYSGAVSLIDKIVAFFQILLGVVD